MRHSFLFCAALMSPFVRTAQAETAPDPNRGIYAIWTRPGPADNMPPLKRLQAKPHATDNLPFLKGGQVVLQWSTAEPSPGQYDFSRLHDQLKEIARLGRVTTVQVNANQLPAFLFDKVPHSHGLIQYWHPYYIKDYTNLIAAFAKEVKSSPFHSRVIGVRLSYNAVGTEHMVIPPEKRDTGQWTASPGVDPAPAWTEDLAREYRRTVVNAYRRGFEPEIRVFLRAGIPGYDDPDQESIRLADEGQGNLGLFTTAADLEPRSAYMAKRYQTFFVPYCRTGKAVCYAESIYFPGGNHAQWNYWRLLADLHFGFSIIGVYGMDLEEASNPEDRSAFDFAARYVGYHASPSVAPGAWVALREGSRFVKGDYTFLMRRLAGAKMKPEQNIGPADQRFGAWAMTLAKGEEVKFELDAAFNHSVQKAAVRVTYLDRGTGAFTLRTAGQQFQEKLTDTGRWKTAQFGASHSPAEIAIAADTDLTLHMVEVVR
jgi:hypothetical protein